jgi:hypothetical protein
MNFEGVEEYRFSVQYTVGTLSPLIFGNIDGSIPLGFLNVPIQLSSKRFRGMRIEGGFISDTSAGGVLIGYANQILLGIKIESIGGQNSDVIGAPLPTYAIQTRALGNKPIYVVYNYASPVRDFLIYDITGVKTFAVQEMYISTQEFTPKAVGDIVTFNIICIFSD